MTHIERMGPWSRQGVVLCVAVIVLSWVWLLSGAGMGMRISAMTTWTFPPGGENAMMPMTWSIGHAALMLVMWSTMMWAMMLPALLADVQHTLRSEQLSIAFVVHYMLTWTMFSVVSTALQFLAESMGWLDSMHMWSIDPSFSTVLAGTAAFSQLVRLGPAHVMYAPACAKRLGRSTYALNCVATTGPMMMLLFVGGVMNLVWIVSLTVWTITRKRWPHPRWHAVASTLICGLLIGQIWA